MKHVSEHKDKVWQSKNGMWVGISLIQFEYIHVCACYYNKVHPADPVSFYIIYDEKNDTHEYFLTFSQVEKAFLNKASQVGATMMLNDSPF